MKRALITGASGQDGHYLTRLLLDQGYHVHLQSRRRPEAEPSGERTTWHPVDLTDRAAVEDLCLSVMPDEIYNLAAISRPQASWEMPLETGLINAMLPHYMLELIRLKVKGCKFYQASSSEMFGNAIAAPQDESTPFSPETPYAISKVYAHDIVTAYRLRYDMFACSGILFNHDSPRRPLSFVTQKIAHAAALVALGVRDSKCKDERGQPILINGRVSLGNLDICRDFGYAGDYVRAMWMMMQHDSPGDYVIGTGVTHSIRDICEVAFSHGKKQWQDHVVVDPSLVRRLDTRRTIANPGKARLVLGWSPTVPFDDMIRMMVDARIEVLKTGGKQEEGHHD